MTAEMTAQAKPCPSLEIPRAVLIELLARAIYDKEALRCRTLDEAESYRRKWPRALPEAEDLVAAIVAAWNERKEPQP